MAMTALLVVDAQKIYTGKGASLACKDAAGTVARINRLIQRFASLKLPVIYIRHQHKRDGSDTGRLFDYEWGGDPESHFGFIEGTSEAEYSDELVKIDGSHHIVKNRYSAFKGTGLQKLLKELGVVRVVICGFMTNFCCESTAREALDLDYYVDFILDATGTPGTEGCSEKKVRAAVAELLSAGLARVLDTETFLESEA